MSFDWTPRPGFSGSESFSRGRGRGALLLLCAFLLSSCGPAKRLFGGGGDAPAGQESVRSAGRDETTKAADAASGVIAPLGPPGTGERPPQPGESGLPYTPDGLPALSPSRGVRFDALFAQEIKDPGERMKRVENAVADLRRDFESVLPAIIRLAAVEKDIQSLTGQLQTLLSSEPLPAEDASSASSPEDPAFAGAAMSPAAVEKVATGPPIAAAPEGKRKPPPEKAVITSAPVGRDWAGEASASPASASSEAPAPSAAPARSPSGEKAGGSGVRKLRLGGHPDKVRIVLDLAAPAKFSHDLDNGEKILVLEVPGMPWGGAAGGPGDGEVIASYRAEPMEGGGSRVVFQLKRETSVLHAGALGADAGNGARIVIDLKK